MKWYTVLRLCHHRPPLVCATPLIIGLISARVHTTYDARRCEMQTVRLKADKQLAQPYKQHEKTNEREKNRNTVAKSYKDLKKIVSESVVRSVM